MTTRGDIKKTKPELQARTAEGKRIPIGFNLSAISNGSGDLVGKVMVFSDLTEVKELERRLRAIDKFRTAGELAAGIAHEIRNPLTSITGSIEMLAESPAVSETNAELLSVMIKESARLNRIIEEFLSYAKRGSLDMRKENLCDIINECIETLDRRGKLPESVRITLVEPTQPAVVSADRALMGQVFFNLLTNAVDAIEGSGIVSIVIQAGGGARPGGGVLEAEEAVKARRMSGYPPDRDRNVPYWSVAVTDNGPGMPPEKLSRIFEPFFTSKKDGVGIGLCIAEKIVREHNGHIDIISEEGQGTSVTVTIPTQQSRTGAEAKDDVCCEEVIADVSCEA